ncbi:hypothetical protein DPMN_033186 [Dreissena polymorpha]|uniref:Uncharacterized protein n=1 Tax=Dreissena polymorpha TaxID=45954 RepID=A0A9D4M4D9_DREPO|nr:hypothetical protein DPMN_033186 [Dreissena polymorpha]
MLWDLSTWEEKDLAPDRLKGGKQQGKEKGETWCREKSETQKSKLGQPGRSSLDRKGIGRSGVHQRGSSRGKNCGHMNHQLSFLLRAVYDMLSTPANLQQWKLTEDPTCSCVGV